MCANVSDCFIYILYYIIIIIIVLVCPCVHVPTHIERLPFQKFTLHKVDETSPKSTKFYLVSPIF